MKKNYLIIVGLPILLVLIGVIYWFVSDKSNVKTSYDAIDYIKSFMTSSGKLNDYNNSLGFKDPEVDFKWYYDSKNVKIEFGYINMKFPIEEFMSDKCTYALSQIGITWDTIKKDDGKHLRIFYLGEEMPRWLE